MKTFPVTSLVGFAGLGLLFLAGSAQAKIARSGDSEDSLLYAASRQNVFAAMTTRDHAPPAPGVALGAGAIIVVEGTKWYTMPTSPRADRPHPLDVTTDLTCSPMQCPTSASATCRTCVSYPTCSGNATCTPDTTCNGTCTFYPTCAGSGQAESFIVSTKTSFPVTSLLGFARRGLLFLVCSTQAKIAPSADPEDNSIVTFNHTNSAPRAFYRLSLRAL